MCVSLFKKKGFLFFFGKMMVATIAAGLFSGELLLVYFMDLIFVFCLLFCCMWIIVFEMLISAIVKIEFVGALSGDLLVN